MKEKLILVHYIDSRVIDNHNMREYLEDVSKYLVSYDKNIHNYIIPIQCETRIECLNPKLVSEEDYKEAKEFLDKNTKIINEAIKNLKK